MRIYSFAIVVRLVLCVVAIQFVGGRAAAATPTANGLLAHWRFDEAPGATVAQEPINGFHATLSTGGAVFTTGGITGNALQFTRASNGHADAGSVLQLNGGPYTVSAWIRTLPGSTDRNMAVLSRHITGTANGYWIVANPDEGSTRRTGWVASYIGDGTSVMYSTALPASGNVNDGQWHHVVGTYDPNGMQRIYVDGLLAAPERASTAYVDASASLVFGALSRASGLRDHFEGWIDEVQFYNRELSPAEILFLQANPGVTIPNELPPLISRQPEDQVGLAGGSVTFDLSVTGTAPFTYQWFHEGIALPGRTNATLALTNLTEASRGLYSVSITNSAGNVTSEAAQLAMPTSLGLLARWSFDDLPGSATAAESVNGLDATLSTNGAALDNSGIAGGALVLDRAEAGSAVVGDILGFGGSRTLSVWVRMTADDATRSMAIIAKHNTGSANGYHLTASDLRLPVGSAHFFIGNDSVVSSTRQLVSSTAINDGQWHHLAATIEDGGRRKLYVDGVPAEADLSVLPYVTNSAPLLFGAATSSGLPANHFHGSLDEVQIYSRALTEAEVSYLKNHPGQSVPAVLPPAIVEHPASDVGLLGGEVTLSAVAVGEQPIGYQWFHEQTLLAGETNASLQLTNLSRSDAGTYFVTVSNVAGSVQSRAATVAVPEGSGLLAYWSLDENAGSATAVDSINGLVANLSANGADFDGGVAGNSLRFERAAEGSAVVGDILDFDLPAQSISAWIRTTEGLTIRSLGIISKHEIGAANGYFLSANASGSGMPNGRATLFAGNNGSISPGTQTVSTTDINDGAWHHVVATYENPGVRRLFVDGLPVESELASTPYQDTAAELMFGALSSGGQPVSHFDGWLDDVQFYARSLNEAEVSYLHLNPGNAVPPIVPPVIVRQPTNSIVPFGGTNTVSVHVNGGGTITFQWTRDGVPIDGATNAVLNLVDSASLPGGMYAVEVSNEAGTATSDAARIAVPDAMGLLAHWRFDQLTGTNVAAERINGLDAVLAGAGAGISTNGISGGALDLSDGTGFARVGDFLHLNESPVAFSVWIRTATSGNRTILSRHQVSSANGWFLSVNSSQPDPSSALFFAGTNGNISAANHLISRTRVVDDQWHHLVVNHTPGGRRTMYVDGVPVEADLPTQAYVHTDAPFLIGAASNGDDTVSRFAGLIDDVQIYARALSPNEVAYLHAVPGATVPAIEPPLITSPPQNVIGQIGSTATLSVQATGGAPLQFQWHHRGAPLPGETNAQLNLPNLSRADAGAYNVVVTNLTAAFVSRPAYLVMPEANGLLARWSFDDPTNSTVASESVNQLEAVLSTAGADIVPDGITGGALRIRREESGAAVVGQVLNFDRSAYTVISWVRIDSTLAHTDLSIIGRKGETNGWLLALNSSASGDPQAGMATFIGAELENGGPLNSPGGLADGQWHQIAVTYEAGMAQQVYVDGVASLDASPAGTIGPTDAPLVIGASSFSSPQSSGGTGGGLVGIVIGVGRGLGSIGNVVGITDIGGSGSSDSAGTGARIRPASIGQTSNVPLLRQTRVYALQNHFSGWLDEMRIYDRALGASEIRFLYQNPGLALPGPSSPTILSHPADTASIVGLAASFEVNAIGTGRLSYRWFQNSDIVPDATNRVLVVDPVTRSRGGLYSVIVANDLGAIASQSAQLRVLVPQTLHSLRLNPDQRVVVEFGDHNGGLLGAVDLNGMQVQRSTNLSQGAGWLTLPGALSITNGRAYFEETLNGENPVRFYRVIQR